MCPKCPGHSSTFLPQVLHLSPGSITPRCGSIRPMSIGKPSSSYVSAVMIFVALILRISSGDSCANLIADILFVTPDIIISSPPAEDA